MNNIKKKPLSDLGYNFVDQSFLPEGTNEYYLRNQQWGRKETYRKLHASEIECLVRNRNHCDDWNNITVAEEFNPQLVQHCHFFGMVRIGKLEACYLEFHDLRLPVGLYNSTISSCDFGDNVVVYNVSSLSHYIIGNEVILYNVNEMTTSDYAKFGNGIVKEGEPENVRIWLELCNENGGRSVLPFDGMLPGDAYIWSKYRSDEELMQRFVSFTEKVMDAKRGYYGTIGERTVIKNCKILKDVRVGTDAYIKGANKLKNLTINSSTEAPSQIGEGCELVNGIIGLGCRIFYGVKAVRFVMASHSQLKYGARLINSYLGNNATISCCEVLNALIFPSHEQHHNNSFLIAATIMGQSNMAAAATIGSNHNSRGADGELVAGRGFWPGLSVTLKHNSRFASFTIISKGNYMAELDVPFPFSLVANDERHNRLMIMPGYWFIHNFYAVARNARKYVDRDKRIERIQHIEYDFLAPDTVEEMVDSLAIMELSVGKAWCQYQGLDQVRDEDLKAMGKELMLNQPEIVRSLLIPVDNIENSKRQVCLLKVDKAYNWFRKMINLYAVENLLQYIKKENIASFHGLQEVVFTARRSRWENVGGQLIEKSSLQLLKDHIKDGTINSWDQVHERYKTLGRRYEYDKVQHAIACMLEVRGLTADDFTEQHLAECLDEAIHTREQIAWNIFESRKKDYTNPFRKMMYENEREMELVVGKFMDNPFINQTAREAEVFMDQVKELMVQWELHTEVKQNE